MNESPFLSIVIILKDFFHLANLTLESIVKQQDSDYEIIIIETAENKKDLIMLKPYLNKIRHIQHFENIFLPFLMNKGLDIAKGKYVHFIFAGDIYLSFNTIKYLKELVKEQEPYLICSAYLRRDEFKSPSVMFFNYKNFRKGKTPISIKACWFLTNEVKKMKGFSEKYKLQTGFDIVCKMFLKKDKKLAFSNRVLIDYQFKKRPSQVFILQSWENLKIIYHHFGFIKTLFWWAIYDHFRMIKLIFLSIKKAFWNA